VGSLEASRRSSLPAVPAPRAVAMQRVSLVLLRRGKRQELVPGVSRRQALSALGLLAKRRVQEPQVPL